MLPSGLSFFDFHSGCILDLPRLPQDGSGEIELDEFLQMMAPKVLLAS